MRPEPGRHYRRIYCPNKPVKVLAVSKDGWVKLRDADGIHFVKESVFEDYFEPMDDESRLNDEVEKGDTAD